ncbi:MAG TPA: hypothetical protein GX725_01620 [Mollicutes bacterium]|nr:hypothetical protein [Mollicutes bacterium]
MNNIEKIIESLLKRIYRNRKKVFTFISFVVIFSIIMLVTKEDELIIIAGYFLIAAFGSALLRYFVSAIISKIRK